MAAVRPTLKPRTGVETLYTGGAHGILQSDQAPGQQGVDLVQSATCATDPKRRSVRIGPISPSPKMRRASRVRSTVRGADRAGGTQVQSETLAG